jgi:translocation and assembly module TamB
VKVRWRKIGLGAGIALVLLAGTLVALWKTGMIEHWARVEAIRQIERATGSPVKMGAFHLHLTPFTVAIDQLTLAGRSTASEPPFLHIARVKVGVDVWALLRGKVVLTDVAVEKPSVYVQIAPDGRSNLPVPPRRGPSKPWQQRLFSITIERLHLDEGLLLFNDHRIPINAEGGRFTFAMNYLAPRPGHDFYQGQIGWKDMRVAALKYVPFPSTWSAKFTIGRQGGSLDEFRWELPHSWIEGRADWPNWTQHRFQAHYRAQLNLSDIRTLLRKPHTPFGVIELTGDLHYAPGAWHLHGYYSARKITMDYKWYHAKNMDSRGTILAGPEGVNIPDFQAWAMGGEFTGRVHMNIHTLDFTATTQSHKVSLADLFDAVQNTDFPVQTLHWQANVDIDSVTTWRADFKDMASRGTMQWTPPAVTPPGNLPATASVKYDYHMALGSVSAQGTIATPHMNLSLKGTIGGQNSNMATDLTTTRLSDWDELIDYLRGRQAKPVPITGQAVWHGSITGPIGHPLFSGHARVRDGSYGQLQFNEIDGRLAYSPSGLELTNMRVRRGSSLASVSLHLGLTKWGFLPSNQWSLHLRLIRADTADLQHLAGTHYPVEALLTGQFEGGGTHSRPRFSGTFQLDDLTSHGYQFAKVTGRLELDPHVIRVAGVTATLGTGRIGGELSYLRPSGQVQFNVFGNAVPLEKVRQIQSPSLPLAGNLDFRLAGSGPLRSLRGEGVVHVTGLRASGDLVGNLTGDVTSDGRHVQVAISSSLIRGKLNGSIGLLMADSYPIHGQLVAEGIDLDPFIQAGLHLKGLTRRSKIDGKFLLTGELRRPETLTVSADVSTAVFAFESVTLENVGPIRLVYRQSDVHVEQAELKGPDSNFRLSGVVRFNRDQPLDLRVLGAINLKLIKGFVPQLNSQGAAQVDAVVQGTFGRPRINGRASLHNASLNYGDLPIGLNNANGDLIFSSDHASFTNLKAEAGGGTLLLNGTVNFPRGASSVLYDIHIQATRVRVRWPAGMSWLISANAQMRGNTRAATLGGRITLDRLLLANGPDAAALLLMAPSQPTVTSEVSSPFLRNLQLDFTVSSGAGSLLQWTGARIETDANVRIRGTWSRPSVLGHVHLISGEVNFRGNKYRLSRGDMNFANPLRLDPVMNIEATTNIQQYEITVDLTGRTSAMRLSYHSDPPLPETDVISLLALGYTGEGSELRSTAVSGQYGATALLSQAVSSEVGGRIARLFGISRFSVEPFPTGTGIEPNAAARITIQQQVTPDLVVTYATNATSNAQQVIQIEYAVSRDISIVALRDINGTFGIDVEFKKHFK